MNNNEPKFTPGPWKVTGFIQNSKYETFGYAIDHESDEHDGFETVAVTYTANEEACQDAHLIAAAPEMYEALETFEHLLTCKDASGMTLETYLRRCCETSEDADWVIDFLGKALAKARGES